jgi:hypothetical protein
MRPEAVDEIPLDVAEFNRRLEAALGEVETMREIGDLCDWFRTRYPTARERLAYVRKRHAEWTRAPASSETRGG